MTLSVGEESAWIVGLRKSAGELFVILPKHLAPSTRATSDDAARHIDIGHIGFHRGVMVASRSQLGLPASHATFGSACYRCQNNHRKGSNCDRAFAGHHCWRIEQTRSVEFNAPCCSGGVGNHEFDRLIETVEKDQQ